MIRWTYCSFLAAHQTRFSLSGTVPSHPGELLSSLSTFLEYASWARKYLFLSYQVPYTLSSFSPDLLRFSELSSDMEAFQTRCFQDLDISSYIMESLSVLRAAKVSAILAKQKDSLTANKPS